MVRLTRIYTKGGDGGQTMLGNGERVSKTDARIVAYGAVDELNAVLGVVACTPGLPRGGRRLLQGIQNDLFDVGADLCVPLQAVEKPDERLRVSAGQVAALEKAIDAHNAKLAPLSSFVLPGGTRAAAWLHVARVVCRRAEIEVARLIERSRASVSEHVLPYLNRLSDLMFVMARAANSRGRRDVLWEPGAGQTARTGSAMRRPPRSASGTAKSTRASASKRARKSAPSKRSKKTGSRRTH